MHSHISQVQDEVKKQIVELAERFGLNDTAVAKLWRLYDFETKLAQIQSGKTPEEELMESVQKSIQKKEPIDDYRMKMNDFCTKSGFSVEEMTNDLKQSFVNRLQKQTWMDAETQRLAKEKALAMRVLIGYPEYIKNPKKLENHYKLLNISDEFFENMKALNHFLRMREINTYGKPIDKNALTVGIKPKEKSLTSRLREETVSQVLATYQDFIAIPNNDSYRTLCEEMHDSYLIEWQLSRIDKSPKQATSTSIPLDMSKVQQLDTPLQDMSAETLNFWLSRFIQEVCNRRGERYPANTLYLLACGIKRFLGDKTGFDPFARGDQRFV
ncbi:Neprilysin [Exaiptasia diaphana]|nr:Neprilysin [Exaiptasia diaphana]